MEQPEEFPALVSPDSVISIPLTHGQRTHFNARHWDLLKDYVWCAAKSGFSRSYYVKTNVYPSDGTHHMLQMHRLVLGVTDPKIQVDHIDYNGLNNLDSNLRLVTNRQNASNLRDKPLMSSRFTGVYLNKKTNRWIARIQIDGKRHTLGSFRFETAARDAYLAVLAELGETLPDK